MLLINLKTTKMLEQFYIEKKKQQQKNQSKMNNNFNVLLAPQNQIFHYC